VTFAALGYVILMALLIATTVWRIAQKGWSYLMFPGGYATMLFAVLTVSDLAVVFSGHPNIWPTSAAVDRFDLRAAPLLLLLVSLLPFWWGESRALRSLKPRVETSGHLFGLLLTGVAVISFGIMIWRLRPASICDYVTNNFAYRLKLGSQGLTIFQLAFALFPVGIALSVPRRIFDTPALLAVGFGVAALSLLASPSKAAVAHAVIAFSFASFWRIGNIPSWARSPKLMVPAAAVGAALLTVSIVAKTSDSLGKAICTMSQPLVTTSSRPLTGPPSQMIAGNPAPVGIVIDSPKSFGAALKGGAGRLLGSDFQTYAVITRRTSETGEFWSGAFNKAAVVNLVPRAIWPGKPASPVALWRYLNGTDDPSGAALMAQGSMFIDFGVLGVLVGMTLGGLLLGLAGAALRRNGISGAAGLAGFAGLMTVPSFVETGFVGAVPTFVGTLAVLMGCWWATTFLGRFRHRASTSPP
jgi:hypothetical protein